MKKTVTANIGGIVFHIDEDAYEKLGNYLSHIKTHFSTDAGRDEILSDIENRIAEMFEEKITASKKVITLEDVNEIISQLGEPEQMAEPEEPANQKKKREQEERTQKRLYRDPDDKYIAGVAGGLGAFSNLDPTWIRVAFVVFTFVYGFGPLLYIILWIVVPKARTTAERLEMRGEKVNISNIEKSIREELNDLKDNIKEFTDETKEHLKKKEKSKSTKEHNSRIAANLVNIFAKAAGIILILIAFSFLVALISGIFIFPLGLHFTDGWQHFSVTEVLSAFISSPQWINATLSALFLIVGIPVFWMLMMGIQLLFDIKTTSKYFSLFTFILWLAAVATVSVSAITSARNFSALQTTAHEHILEEPMGESIYLKINESANFSRYTGRNLRHNQWRLFLNSHHQIAYGVPELRIRTSASQDIELRIIHEARGQSLYHAEINAENILYEFSQSDSLIIFDPVFSYDKTSGWRNQRVKLELRIPEDKILTLDPQLRRSILIHHDRSVKVNKN